MNDVFERSRLFDIVSYLIVRLGILVSTQDRDYWELEPVRLQWRACTMRSQSRNEAGRIYQTSRHPYRILSAAIRCLGKERLGRWTSMGYGDTAAPTITPFEGRPTSKNCFFSEPGVLTFEMIEIYPPPRTGPRELKLPPWHVIPDQHVQYPRWECGGLTCEFLILRGFADCILHQRGGRRINSGFEVRSDGLESCPHVSPTVCN